MGDGLFVVGIKFAKAFEMTISFFVKILERNIGTQGSQTVSPVRVKPCRLFSCSTKT